MKSARFMLVGLVFLGVWGDSRECWARLVKWWSLTELHESADLVVVGLSGETGEGTLAVPAGRPWEPVVTSFRLLAVFKTDSKGAGAARDGLNPLGRPNERRPEAAVEPVIRVNHFKHRRAGLGEANGAQFVHFQGKPRTYLLFLKHSGDDNYEFVTSPWDPYMSALTVGGYQRPDPKDIGDTPEWNAFLDVTDDGPLAKFTSDVAKLPKEKKELALERLRLGLKSPELVMRRRAAMTLKTLGDDRGVPVLIADFPQTAGHQRDVQIQALLSVADRRTIPVLREALGDKSVYIRDMALKTLGELKATEAFDDIVAQLREQGDPPEYLRKHETEFDPVYPADYACYTLAVLGDMRAVPILIDHLKKARRPGPAQRALESLKKQHEEQQRQKMASDPEKWSAWWKRQGE